jgi:type III secretion protein J
VRYFYFLFAILLLFTGCNKRTTIVNSVSERDANEIVVLLASKNIPAEKIPTPVATGGAASKVKLWDVSVPSMQITESLSLLTQAGLPRIQGTNLLDLFGSQGLVPSDLQDRIRYQEGLSAQLSNTIRKMDGIIDANVQITLPKEEETQETLTASIYIKHRGVLDNPNSVLVNKIKRLVSSALPGLTPDNVSVVSDRATYTDLSFNENEIPESQGFVQIWGVRMTRDSASLFRFIFYAFIILLFITLSIIIWLGWKFYPLIEKRGFKSLILPEQYSDIAPQENTEGLPPNVMENPL